MYFLFAIVEKKFSENLPIIHLRIVNLNRLTNKNIRHFYRTKRIYIYNIYMFFFFFLEKDANKYLIF